MSFLYRLFLVLALARGFMMFCNVAQQRPVFTKNVKDSIKTMGFRGIILTGMFDYTENKHVVFDASILSVC